ncbi:helix-turn-helix domain-containing protein [Massilia sp. SYSU DXS3249]
MPSFETLFVDLDIRTYPQQPEGDRHAWAQLVLPLSGELQLEIEGETGRLDPLHGALVVPGAWHSQYSERMNRSFILDLDEAAMAHDALARLAERPFTAIGPAARKLIDYMELMRTQPALPPALVQGWVPLLLDTLVLDAPQERSRLAALLAQVRAQPGHPWNSESMARYACLSASRLHALFRAELDTSPHAWLQRQRIEYACRRLAGTNQAIAEVALQAGFSDQSALTRAMRQQLDTTPAAYRRRSRQHLQETPPKTQ